MNACMELLTSQDSPMHESLAQELSVVAAQFIEAACRARGGDREATRAHVAHAIALLRGIPSLAPSGGVPLHNAAHEREPDALARRNVAVHALERLKEPRQAHRTVAGIRTPSAANSWPGRVRNQYGHPKLALPSDRASRAVAYGRNARMVF